MAEAMKKGLTCHVIGAGATHSPVKRFIYRPAFRPLLQKMVAMQVPTKKT